jgi:hypothetical protein
MAGLSFYRPRTELAASVTAVRAAYQQCPRATSWTTIDGSTCAPAFVDRAAAWTVPVEPWVPPLERAELENLVERFRAWRPYDGGVLLDDVAEALDDLMPDEEGTQELGQRLCGHLTKLVTIAVAAKADQADERAALLIERARAVRSQDVPGDHRRVVGHLRRMGWIVNELLERLVETQCLKEAA